MCVCERVGVCMFMCVLKPVHMWLGVGVGSAGRDVAIAVSFCVESQEAVAC